MSRPNRCVAFAKGGCFCMQENKVDRSFDFGISGTMEMAHSSDEIPLKAAGAHAPGSAQVRCAGHRQDTGHMPWKERI
jgi:hypothetical protein